MSFSLGRGGSRDAAKSDLKAPSVPQVNLLPASIADAKEAGKLKRWCGLALVLALVIVGGFYFLATQEEADARDRLDAARDETTALTRERNRLSYVPTVYNFLDRIDIATRTGMFSEVLLQQYLDAFATVLPEDASFTNISYVVNPENLIPSGAPSLIEPHVAVITFDTRSATVPDTAAWLTGLNSIHGLSNASLNTTTITEDDGSVYYETAVTVYATYDALSLRFEEVDVVRDEDADDTATQDEED